MFIKIKNFVMQEWKFLLFLLLFYFAMTYEFPYVVYTPGGHINMSERVSGEGTYEEEGSLSMTYVSLVKGTIPFLALSKVIPNWDMVKTDTLTYDGVDYKDTVEIDKIYMKEAISNAEYVAYTHAGIDFEETNIHHTVTYISSDAKTNLKYGDEILGVDGKEYTTLSDFQNYVGSKGVGDTVTLEYKRKDKTYKDEVTLIELDGTAKVGISIASISDYETPFDISVKTKQSESGPSGGLITALEIYNKVTESDITSGKTIMGTGTISKDGKVGEIGGVKYKLLGAHEDGAEVFICPKKNYEEALEVKQKEKMNVIIIGVSTFEEALEKLKNI